VSGHLNPGGQRFRGDRGAADPLLTAALAAYQVGQGSEQAALTALAAARLLVPVIAVLGHGAAIDGAPTDGAPTDGAPTDGAPTDGAPTDGAPTDGAPTAPQGDKDSEMVLPTLIGRDGRPAVLAFTGLDALARWRPDARPMPAEADRVWRAAVADGCAVVIDVAGPVPLAVEGARLAALAAGQSVPLPYDDPDVRAEVQAAIAAEPVIAGFSLAPGRDDGPDLTVTLYLAGTGPAARPARDQNWGPAVNRAAADLAARLGTRLRRGIEVIVAASSH
jgi:SseB protein N-terminal domain